MAVSRVVLACLALEPLSASAAAQSRGRQTARPPVPETIPLQGEWVIVDRKMSGPTRLVISRAGSGWQVHAWGGCVPKDCDWGTVALFPLAPSVSEVGRNRGFAFWDRGFANRYMTISLDEGGLVVEMVTIFRDGSSRSNMHTTASLRRPSR